MQYNTLNGLFNCWLGVTFSKCIFCGQLVGDVGKNGSLAYVWEQLDNKVQQVTSF